MRYALRTSLLASLAAMIEVAVGQVQPTDTLQIYVIDVEGGGATLFVAPGGQSLLIDTGNGGAAAQRDAGRIMTAIEDAGLDAIDTLIITHYHGDHIGGLAELASRIPIRRYVDHGPNVQTEGSGAGFLPHYEELYGQAEHLVVGPGDEIGFPLPVLDGERAASAAVEIQVVASAARVIDTPLRSGGQLLPGAGVANPYCEGLEPIDPDLSENAQSVAISLSFGRFRVAHLGDLTWNGELELMCPINKFGTADLFIVSHHAQQRPASMSNSRALVHGLQPRVAISSNGIRKGAQVAAMEILFTSPGLEDIWQMHFSQFSGQEYTVPGLFIANRFDGETTVPIAPTDAQSPTPSDPPIPPHEGPAHYFEIAARPDGSFTVTNTRNGFSKTYDARS